MDYAFNQTVPPLLRIQCWRNSHQEPYYFLQRTPSTPLFDEQYMNYGYNKMQHMDELRAKGINRKVF